MDGSSGEMGDNCRELYEGARGGNKEMHVLSSEALLLLRVSEPWADKAQFHKGESSLKHGEHLIETH